MYDVRMCRIVEARRRVRASPMELADGTVKKNNEILHSNKNKTTTTTTTQTATKQNALNMIPFVSNLHK